jgi:hypothetical protein
VISLVILKITWDSWRTVNATERREVLELPPTLVGDH